MEHHAVCDRKFPTMCKACLSEGQVSNTMTYQVGALLKLDQADPELSSEQDATSLALRESDVDQNTPFGVWTGQEHGSELLAIAYQGTLFKQAY